jgi:hypothetical protein
LFFSVSVGFSQRKSVIGLTFFPLPLWCLPLALFFEVTAFPVGSEQTQALLLLIG